MTAHLIITYLLLYRRFDSYLKRVQKVLDKVAHCSMGGRRRNTFNQIKIWVELLTFRVLDLSENEFTFISQIHSLSLI